VVQGISKKRGPAEREILLICETIEAAG